MDDNVSKSPADKILDAAKDTLNRLKELAFEEGQLAYFKDDSFAVNPYDNSKDLSRSWGDGFITGALTQAALDKAGKHDE